MKLSFAISALLCACSAIQLDKTSLASMSQQDLKNMVENQMKETISMATTQEEAKQKDAEMRNVAQALGQKIIDRLNVYGVPYGYPIYPYIPYTSPYYADVVGIIASANAYNDYIRRYEIANAIAGLYNPTYDQIVSALKAAVTPAAPSSASLLQMEGVPVYVNPTLIKNDAANEDLGQRGIIIDGVDGFDYLQTNGVPVFVNPEVMIQENTEAKTNLGFVDMVVGPDELSFLQQQHRDFVNKQKIENHPDDGVVLQVNGVPVFVNPEVMILQDTEAKTNLGFVNMVCGPDELSFVQKELKSIDDDEMASALEGFTKQIAEINAKYTQASKK